MTCEKIKTMKSLKSSMPFHLLWHCLRSRDNGFFILLLFNLHNNKLRHKKKLMRQHEQTEIQRLNQLYLYLCTFILKDL